MTGVSYGLRQVFARAAYIHVGAMMGTMMAANVFFVIIPNQRKMVDAMIAGEEPMLAMQGHYVHFTTITLRCPCCSPRSVIISQWLTDTLQMGSTRRISLIGADWSLVRFVV